jgi:hypothetical protein
MQHRLDGRHFEKFEFHTRFVLYYLLLHLKPGCSKSILSPLFA